MLRKLTILALIVLFSGCANTAYQKHQNKLQELDSLYESGQIDAVQYQAKYSEEVQDHNTKTAMTANMLTNDRK